jgi:hypothetical protein
MSHELDKATDIVEPQAEDVELTEIKEAIETLELLLEYSSKKEKKEITEAIDVLELLLSTY